MPTPFDGYVEVSARVSSTCLASSVPCHLANHKVAIHLYSDRIETYVENTRVACHARLLSASEVTSHLVNLPPSSLARASPASTCRSAMTTLPPPAAAMRVVCRAQSPATAGYQKYAVLDLHAIPFLQRRARDAKAFDRAEQSTATAAAAAQLWCGIRDNASPVH